MRKAKKKPLTDRAAKMAFNVLSELYQNGDKPEMVLAQSEFYGWTGLFPVSVAFGQMYMASKRQSENL